MTARNFFKKDEIVNELNVVSTQHYAAAYDACETAVFNRFDKVTENINLNIKCVIGAWRRGYSSAAAADYLFIRPLDDYTISQEYNVNTEATKAILKAMCDKMGYLESHWGVGYDYQPSLEEMHQDPLQVQSDINTRAVKFAKLTNSDQFPLFGTYTNNCGALRRDIELASIREFIANVKAMLLSRQSAFFPVV